MIKKLKESKFVFNEDNTDTPLEIYQFEIVKRLAGKCRVYLTKKEARSLYTFLKKVFE